MLHVLCLIETCLLVSSKTYFCSRRWESMMLSVINWRLTRLAPISFLFSIYLYWFMYSQSQVMCHSLYYVFVSDINVFANLSHKMKYVWLIRFVGEKIQLAPVTINLNFINPYHSKEAHFLVASVVSSQQILLAFILMLGHGKNFFQIPSFQILQ